MQYLQVIIKYVTTSFVMQLAAADKHTNVMLTSNNTEVAAALQRSDLLKLKSLVCIL